MLIHKTLAVTLSVGLLAIAPSFAQYPQSGSHDKDKDKDKQEQSSTDRDKDRDRNTASARDDQDKNKHDEHAGQLSNAERKFLTNAAQGSVAEIELGKLAEEKGFTQQVKDLGKKLSDDHQKALEKEKEIAQKNNVTLPDQPTNKQKAVHDRLAKLSGVEFDRAFAREVTRDHNKDISEFQKMSEKAGNADVKQFASDTISSLKEHQQMAMAITNVTTSADGRSQADGNRKGEMKPDQSSPRTDEPPSRPNDERSRPNDEPRKPAKPNEP